MSKIILFNNANAVPAAAAGNTNPSDIAEARVAAFDADDWAAGTLDLTAPLPETVKRIQFVQGAKSGEDPIISPIINVHKNDKNFDVESVDVQAYIAPVAQVTRVTPETGTGNATIILVRKDTGYRPDERTSVTVKLDGKTVAQIIDDFVTAINATNFPVTASNNADTDLDITADTDETDHTNPAVSFFTALDEEATDWTKAVQATPNFGSGTAFHVNNLEEIAWGGNYTNRIYLPITPPRYAEDDTYDLNTLQIRTNTTENIAKSNKYYELIIAVHNVQSGIDLEEFFFGDRPAT